MNTANNSSRGIDVYYRESPNLAAADTHFHNVHEIIFVADGSVRIQAGSKTYSASGNTIVFFSNLEKHSVTVTQAPYKRYVVSLSQNYTHQMLKDSPLLSILLQRPESFSHAIALDDKTAGSIRKVLDTMVAEASQQKAFWTLRLSLLFTDLLIRLYRYSNSAFPVNAMDDAARIVTETQRYITEHAHEDISLDQLAARHFISKYHLSRIFSRITGYTFRDYLILHRLSIAKDLLLHTGKPVSEIGQLCGYGNVNHFIRIFKAHEGLSPHRYRKAHRGQ